MPYFASATSLQPSKIIRIGKNVINKIFNEFPHIATRLLKSMGRKIRLLSLQVGDLTFLDVEKRVAHILIKLMGDFGIRTDKGIRLSIIISDHELGNLVGVRREKITKVLNEFKKRGYLYKEKRQIIFTDPNGLMKCIFS